MKYYSEILRRFYNTEAELVKAEEIDNERHNKATALSASILEKFDTISNLIGEIDELTCEFEAIATIEENTELTNKVVVNLKNFLKHFGIPVIG